MTLASSFASVLTTQLSTVWATQPYTVAAVVCGLKASAADYLAQKRQSRKKEQQNAAQKAIRTDRTRNFSFLLYGSLYQGIAQEYIYNHLYPVWFDHLLVGYSGTFATLATACIKVAFDLLVQTCLVTLPIAYLVKAVIFRYGFREAIVNRYWGDITQHGLLKKYYLLWGPVNILTFSVVPEAYRITWIAFVSFFWLVILSTISSKSDSAVPAPAVKSTLIGDDLQGTVFKVDDDDDDDDDEYCDLEDGLTCKIDG